MDRYMSMVYKIESRSRGSLGRASDADIRKSAKDSVEDDK